MLFNASRSYIYSTAYLWWENVRLTVICLICILQKYPNYSVMINFKFVY